MATTNYKRTAYGRFMYSLEMRWGKWLSKRRWLWVLLNLTWGLPITLIGAAIALWLLLTGHKASAYHGETRFGFGNNWGGLEGGLFIFVAGDVSDDWYEHVNRHELGHSYQNALFGPFNLLLTYLPSVIRYWSQRIRSKKGLSNPPYDAVWFEGSATDLGDWIVEEEQKEGTVE